MGITTAAVSEINQYKHKLKEFSDNIKKLNETQSMMHVTMEECRAQTQTYLNENDMYKK